MYELIVFALATWRLAYLIAEEEGPFEIFTRIREISGVIHKVSVYSLQTVAKDGSDKYVDAVIREPYDEQPTVLARGLTCTYCTGFWVAIALCVINLLSPTVALVIATPMAIAAIAIGWGRLIGH